MILGYQLLVMALVGYFGWWMHEAAHYFTGFIWTNQQKLIIRYYIVPRSVDFSACNLPPMGIRITGAAPLLLLLPSIALTWRVLIPLGQSGNLLLAAAIALPSFAAALPISKKDRQAIFSPAEWG
ncbi:hypothetical protein [Haloarcula salinisoli]|uniref:Zincin peptidase n=1 Tax=Haloarcula salinisoli TaxID=2487746 RepID=A0A8J7YF40_9EURY|nr:hypothetical protein [Halomicroarcula salinisoli]MBX0304730.1 hypothetical protein [Halomicroarcula salinisoli]